jgi:hypothetical protein
MTRCRWDFTRSQHVPRGGRYRNSAETAAFLDKQSSTYVGGFVEMCNTRLYGVWGELTEALKTGEPQSEVKLKPFFEEIYSDPAKLEQFMQAMSGLSLGDVHALAERFDLGRYGTVCDVGGPRADSVRPLPGATPICAARPMTSRWWRRSPRGRSPRPG